MKIVHVKDKLDEMGVGINDINFGDFDLIAEFTAKRIRSPNDQNYRTVGAFYRSNYERGILVYNLIRRYNLQNMLEIGYGRGYVSFCAAKAFYDSGTRGNVVTIDPAASEQQVEQIAKHLAPELFAYIKLHVGKSEDVLPTMQDQKFDLVYIDGDHSYEATKSDWKLTRCLWQKFLLFDDYHLPTKNDPGIQCNRAIDEIEWSKEGAEAPELVIMDRRLFVDDRKLSDDQIDYGQVLVTKSGITHSNEW